MVEANKVEIEEAIRRLNVSSQELRRLRSAEARWVFDSAETRFVRSDGRQWWWEDFKMPAAWREFPACDGYRFLNKVLPSLDDPVWFIIETDDKDSVAVYEGRVSNVQEILGECYAFEYYLVAKDFSWLVCENHHNVVFAIGPEVEKRLHEIEI